MTTRKNIMTEFEIGEISSVDRPAQPGAKAVMFKRDSEEVKKAIAVTTINAGHAHTISTYGEDGVIMRTGHSSWDQTEGHEHKHEWATDEHGNIIIADSAGHGHGLAALITKKDISPEEDPLADLLSKGNETASEQSEDNTMTDVEKKQLADLEKSVADVTARAEKAEQLSKLNDSEKEHLTTLEGDKADEFLAKSAADRKTEIDAMAKADAVIYTDLDGGEYRKSDDSRLLAMAKRGDTERKARIAGEEKIAKAELAKSAESISSLPGEDEDRIALMKGISLLGDEDKALALKCLNASEEAMAKGFKTLGTQSTPKEPNSSEEALEAIAKTLRDNDPTLTEAESFVKAMETPEGLALYSKHTGLNS
jgi:hypothetical protein